MTIEVGSIRTVAKNFGVRKTDQKYGSRIDADVIKTAIWTFPYDDLPVASTNKLTLTIPNGSIVLDAYFNVLTAFAGGTSYDIDLVDNTSTAIGVGKDKLWDALVLADIDATVSGKAASVHGGTNSGIACANKASTGQGWLAAAGQLLVVATGTFTAGVGQIIIRYIDNGGTPEA